MSKLIKRFMSDDRGLETVEYAIIAGLCVVAVIAGGTLLWNAVQNKFEDVAEQID